MTVRKKGMADGVITFHTTKDFAGVLKDGTSCTSEMEGSPSFGGVRKSSGTGSTMARSDRTSNETFGPRMLREPWAEQRRSYISSVDLQAKMDNEMRKANTIIQPLLDDHNSFLKEMDSFLGHWDMVQLRRKELLHKRWTEHVWMPTYRTLTEHVANNHHEMAGNLQFLFQQYISHCNAKGFVFQETFDPQEYNPYLFKVHKPHHFKIGMPALRDPLLVQSRKKIEESRAVLSCQTGKKFTRKQVEDILTNHLPHVRPLSQSTVPQTKTSLKPRPGVTLYQKTGRAASDGRFYRRQCATSGVSTPPHTKCSTPATIQTDCSL